MKKKLLTMFLFVMVAAICFSTFTACNKNKVSADSWTSQFAALEKANNFTVTMGSATEMKLTEVAYGVKMMGNEVVFAHEDAKYFQYLKEDTTGFVKNSITKDDFDSNLQNYRETAAMFAAFKDNYASFNFSDGKFVCASLDKTKSFGAVLKDVAVTFADGILASVTFTSDMDGADAEYTLSAIGSTSVTLPQATDGHIHSLKVVAAVQPTCETSGNIQYWQCEGCHGMFADENNNVSVNASDVKLAALDHAWSTDWQKDEKHHWHECTRGCTFDGNWNKDGYGEHSYDETHYCVCGQRDMSVGSDGLALELSANEQYYIVTGIGTATDTQLILPKFYNGLPVKEIKAEAFEDCETITSIVVQDTLSSIGEYAFAGCSNINEVRFRGDIGTWCCIDGVGNLMSHLGDGKLYIDGEEITDEIVIPSNVPRIADGAFYRLHEVKKVTFAASSTLTSIGDSAFYGILSLKTIEIPSSVTTIGEYAFSSSGLESVSFGENSQLKSIGYRAFRWCASLTSVQFGTNSVLETIGEEAFGGCEKLADFTIPASVKTVENKAFEKCNALTEVGIPSAVTSIGYGAFQDCANLKKVILGDDIKLEFIQYGTFDGCTSFEYNEYHNSRYIGTASNPYLVFMETADLAATIHKDTKVYADVIEYQSGTSLTIEKGLSVFPDLETSYGYGVDEIRYTGTIADWCKLTDISKLLDGNTRTLYIDGKEITGELIIPAEVTALPEYAFYGTTITSVKFAEGTQATSIGKYALWVCRNLASITIPASVKYIGECAVWSDDVLNSVIFENPEGWKCGKENFSSDILSDPARAAQKYRAYRDDAWTRS